MRIDSNVIKKRIDWPLQNRQDGWMVGRLEVLD